MNDTIVETDTSARSLKLSSVFALFVTMQRNPACSNDVTHDNVPDKFNWIFNVNASEVANRFKIDIVAEIEYCTLRPFY